MDTNVKFGDYIVRKLPLIESNICGFVTWGKDTAYAVCRVERYRKSDINPTDYKVKLVPMNDMFVERAWYACDIFSNGFRGENRNFGTDFDAAYLCAFELNNKNTKAESVVRTYKDERKHYRIVVRKEKNGSAHYLVENDTIFGCINWKWNKCLIDVEYPRNYITSLEARFDKLEDCEKYISSRIK